MPSGGRQTKWILESVTPPEDFTGDTETVVALETVYLKINPSGGRKLQRAQQIDPQITHVVECHYRPAITSETRFRRNERILNIVSVMNVGEENRMMRINVIETLLEQSRSALPVQLATAITGGAVLAAGVDVS